jgi:glucose-like phosphotransferase system IIB component
MTSATSRAEGIVEAVGGPSNILSLTHCATRLRFELRDASVVDQKAVERVPGVMGAVPQAGDRYQVVIRTDVLRADLRALLDHVDERHRVTTPEAVVRRQPRDDLARLHARLVEAALCRERDELARREARLVLDRVEVRLKRHVSPSGPGPPRRRTRDFQRAGPVPSLGPRRQPRRRGPRPWPSSSRTASR